MRPQSVSATLTKVASRCRTYPGDEAAEAQASETLLTKRHLPALDGRNNQLGQDTFKHYVLFKGLIEHQYSYETE